MLHFQKEPVDAALQPIIVRDRCPILDFSVVDERCEADMPGYDDLNQVMSETVTELSVSADLECQDDGGVADYVQPQEAETGNGP